MTDGPEISRRVALGAAGAGLVTVTLAACSSGQPAESTTGPTAAEPATASGPPAPASGASKHIAAPKHTAAAPTGAHPTPDEATTRPTVGRPTAEPTADGSPAAHTQTHTSSAPDPTPTAPRTTPAPANAIVPLAAIPVGGSTSGMLNGKPIALGRPGANSVNGLSAICTHMGCTVGTGGSVLHCPCHGSTFNAFTGAVVNGPATTPLPGVAVKIQDGYVVPA